MGMLGEERGEKRRGYNGDQFSERRVLLPIRLAEKRKQLRREVSYRRVGLGNGFGRNGKRELFDE